MKFWIYVFILVISFIADLYFAPTHGSILYVVISIAKMFSSVAIVINWPKIDKKK